MSGSICSTSSTQARCRPTTRATSRLGRQLAATNLDHWCAHRQAECAVRFLKEGHEDHLRGLIFVTFVFEKGVAHASCRADRHGVLAAILFTATAVHAQASITGVARDSSGAVLPGVTVEASSPALIEKTRSVVTGGTGQYAIVDLRPGTYTVTFTLPGFNTVRREGIELTGNFVASVSVEMRVGAVAETVTVSGEAPIVDVTNSRRQQTISGDVIAAIPSSRQCISA